MKKKDVTNKKKKTYMSHRFDVLASIMINRIDDVEGNRKRAKKAEKQRQAELESSVPKPKKRPVKQKTARELMLANLVKNDLMIPGIEVHVVEIAAAIKKQKVVWFDNLVAEAVKRAGKMYGKSIINSLNKAARSEDGVYGVDQRSKTTIDNITIKTIFKVCAFGDDKIAGFTVCSPSDIYNKNFGTQYAISRYNRGINIVKTGIEEKRYAIPMVAENGSPRLGLVIGENKDASIKKLVKLDKKTTDAFFVALDESDEKSSDDESIKDVTD